MQSNGADAGDRHDVYCSFVCPINLVVMRDPVVAADGFSYEREAIERWLQNNQTSPKTNLRMPSVALLPNHALKHAIEEFHTRSQVARTSLGQRAGPNQEGLRAEDRPDDALEDLPESGLFVYMTLSTAQVYLRPNFDHLHDALSPGTFVVADRREYGPSRSIFARLEDGNYVIEQNNGSRVLQRVQVNTTLRVYRVLLPTGWRKEPSCLKADMIDSRASARPDEMVSSTLSFVDPTRPVTYLRPEGSRYWLFTETLIGETCVASVPVERRPAPLIYELTEHLKLRQWPHWNCSREPVVEIRCGTFKKAECRIRDPKGHYHIRVNEGGIRGWLPVHALNGERTMKVWTSPPRPLCEGPAGKRIQVCLGYSENSWLVALDREMPNYFDQRLAWVGVPEGLARQLLKLEDRGQVLRRASFSQYNDTGWYLSVVEREGSGQGWSCSRDELLDDFREQADVDCVVAFGDEMRYGFRRGFEYLIAHTSGVGVSQGIPDDMMEAFRDSTSNVTSALLTADGQWVLVYDDGACDYRLHTHPNLRREIDRSPRGSGNLCSAALSDGTGNWIVIREHGYTASRGIDDRLKERLDEFYFSHRQRRNERRRARAAYREALLG